jgi:hypothetical protein
MSGFLRKTLVLAAVLGLSGCGGSEDEFTANVEGEYTVALTNRENGCAFMNWMEGESTTGIPITFTQEGAKLNGTVQGVWGGIVTLILGSPDFEGSVKRSDFTLTNYGTRSAMMNNCTFTYNATLQGTLTENAIAGTMTYSPATNDNPDCAELECSSLQEFSGSRPAK